MISIERERGEERMKGKGRVGQERELHRRARQGRIEQGGERKLKVKTRLNNYLPAKVGAEGSA